MLTLSTTPKKVDRLRLGSHLRVHIECHAPDLETRVLLAHLPVVYSRPLREWSLGSEPVDLYPESPGSYRVEVQWRNADGDRGHQTVSFRMTSPKKVGRRAMTAEPRLSSFGAEAKLWTPGAWDAGILKKTEKPVIQSLRHLIKPGGVAYDLGANVGLFTSLLAHAVGPRGAVYAVEANPICLQYLRTNVLRQKLDHVEILPVAVLHHEGQTPFMVNYGNSNLGLSQASSFYPQKTGHEIMVPCYSLDALIEEMHLRPPDLVKIDVEGAERWVIEGMSFCLGVHRPTLLLEIHHARCAADVLERLDLAGYDYRTPGDLEQKLDSEQVQATFGDTVFQLIAQPKAP